MARVILIHIGMLAGMCVLAWVGEVPTFFGVFVVMKLAADVIVLVSHGKRGWDLPEKPPTWVVFVFARGIDLGEFEAGWRRHRASEHALQAEDEQTHENAAPASRDGA